VAGEGTGRVVVLTGDEPVLLFDGDHRVPVHTDLDSVGECALGTGGGLVLTRSVNQAQERTTMLGGSICGAGKPGQGTSTPKPRFPPIPPDGISPSRIRGKSNS
jgi:hypothetical protein